MVVGGVWEGRGGGVRGRGGGANHLMTRSPREIIIQTVAQCANMHTAAPETQNRKKHRHCKAEASRHGKFKSVSSEIQVRLVGLRSVGAVRSHIVPTLGQVLCVEPPNLFVGEFRCPPYASKA